MLLSLGLTPQALRWPPASRALLIIQRIQLKEILPMKTLAKILAFTLLLNGVLLYQPTVLAQKPKPARTARQTPAQYSQAIKQFEEFARKHMALDKTVGLTIGFVKDDFTWVNAYGYADLENKVPAKAESAYRLASVTKPMTAIAVMQLVEKGKINLDAEVQTYVPYFPKKQSPVTVRQLLGHLGGISHYKDPATELHIKDHKSTRDAIGIFEKFDLVAEPGTRYSYSSYGYNLLGAVIEGASGMSYGDYMRQNVWLPLGMTDTRMDDPLDVIPNRVRGYQLINGKVKNSEFVDISSRFAAGGTHCARRHGRKTSQSAGYGRGRHLDEHERRPLDELRNGLGNHSL